MSVKKNINRRDFLKLGGLTAVSLPVITQIGKIGSDDLLESEEIYGGFAIRQRADDDPLFTFDDSYTRFDATNAILSRIWWDDEFNEKSDATETVYEKNDPGYTQVDKALSAGAAFVAMYEGTDSSIGYLGLHDGLMGLDPKVNAPGQGPQFEGRWDHDHLTSEEVTAIVKKASLFLGASMVGVTDLNEKWLYSHYYDGFSQTRAPIKITKVEKVELPEGQVSPEDARQLIKAEIEPMGGQEIKDLLVDVLESIDPNLLPSNAPSPSFVKAVPVSKFQGQGGQLVTNLPKVALGAIAEKLGLDIEIAEVDPGESAKPRYLEDGALAIPETMNKVIVLAFEEDFDGIEAAPTHLTVAITQDAYSKMAITGGSLAQFIRKLGYNAIPCGNNTNISVPMAIEAGLGEGGRSGMLITPKYGPRVRIAKVITDMPLENDKPIKFGVEEFCKACMKCAELCPSQAISYEDKTMEAANMSSNSGVLKWSSNPEKCWESWIANGSGCGMCIRVCPFNKPESWLHDVTRIMIGANSGSIDKLLVNLDDAGGYGKQEPNMIFWESDKYIHIKD
ncbi:MAG: reductive dehalogenase [Anaerolineales bacterium]|nr:reductive dehalogenase [Anaerolineales bacterium]